MNPSPPQVSVIVPVCNSERYLGAALASILTQSCSDVEILVIDDGSATDACTRVVDESQRQTGRQIRSVRQPHRGAAAARNRGLAEARGELIAFLDSDDMYEPSKLTVQADMLGRLPPDYGFVTGGYLRFADDAPNQVRVILPPVHEGTLYPALLRPGGGLPWAPGAHLFRRSALEAVGGYDEGLRYGEDKELLIRLARTHKGRTHRAVVYRKRWRRDSLSASLAPGALIADTTRLTERLRAADPLLPSKLLRRLQQEALLAAASETLRCPGNRARFASLLSAAVRQGFLLDSLPSWRALWTEYAAVTLEAWRRPGLQR
jgi:glycosyltransferase involved in cell wall biosynthesis